MADLETMHRITEKLEVTGEKDASKKMDTAANAAGKLAEALGFTSKKGMGTTGVLKDVEQAANKASGKKGGGGMGGFFGSMVKANLIAGVLTKAVSWLTGKLSELARQWWDVNYAIESAGSRIQGIGMGMLDWGKGSDKVGTSAKLANVLLAEFRDIAMDVAVPVEQLEASYARVNSVVAAMGKNQYETLKTTRLTASAAKVYGENMEMAGSIISKAIIEGTVEGESAFAKAFKAQVGAMPGQGFNKLPIEKRFEKIKKVLTEMGEPVSTVTKDTAGALDRWKVLSEDVLQRVTYPLYQKIGQTVQKMVDYLEANKGVIDKIVDKAQHWFSIIWDTGAAILDVTSTTTGWFLTLTRAEDKMRALYKMGELLFQVVGFIGHGWKMISALIEYIAAPEKGLGKLNALSEGLWYKFMKLGQTLKDMGRYIIKAFGGDGLDKYIRKIPGVGKQLGTYLDQLKAADRFFDKQVDDQERRVAMLEKKFGLSPSTELGQQMEREALGLGMSKDARINFLKSLFGKKRPLINVQNMNVQQDFRDADPDNIMIEMVRLYENLAEEALSSNIGGEESVFAGAS